MLQINLKFSKKLFILFFLIAIGAIFSVWLCDFSIYLKIISSIFILFYTFLVSKKYFLLNEHSISGLYLLEKNQWRLQTSETQYLANLIQGYMGFGLIILNFKLLDSNKKMTLILANDALNANDWRRLRMHLNHGVYVA